MNDYLSIQLWINYLSKCKHSTLLSVHLTIYMNVYISNCLYVSIYPNIYLFNYISIQLSLSNYLNLSPGMIPFILLVVLNTTIYLAVKRLRSRIIENRHVRFNSNNSGYVVDSNMRLYNILVGLEPPTEIRNE